MENKTTVMGFADTGAAKIRELKALRKSLHRRTEHFNVKGMDIKQQENIKQDFPKTTKSQLKTIRENARDDKKKDLINKVFNLFIAIMLTIAIIGYLIIAATNL